MNIETKVVKASGNSSYAEKMEEYLNFGWTHTEDTRVRSGRGHRQAHVLARDKDMPNYGILVKLENEYFNLRQQKKAYNPMEWEIVLLAFALFIVPGLIYVAAKSNQKKKIDEHNAKIQKQMNAIVAKAKPLL